MVPERASIVMSRKLWTRFNSCLTYVRQKCFLFNLLLIYSIYKYNKFPSSNSFIYESNHNCQNLLDLRVRSKPWTRPNPDSRKELSLRPPAYTIRHFILARIYDNSEKINIGVWWNRTLSDSMSNISRERLPKDSTGGLQCQLNSRKCTLPLRISDEISLRTVKAVSSTPLRNAVSRNFWALLNPALYTLFTHPYVKSV